MMEPKRNLSFVSAAAALRQTLDTLNVEGITIGCYEIMCMFNRQALTAEKQAMLTEQCALNDLQIIFHSREQIVVMRKPENMRFPRMLTTEFETAVREARSAQHALAALDSEAADPVS